MIIYEKTRKVFLKHLRAKYILELESLLQALDIVTTTVYSSFLLLDSITLSPKSYVLCRSLNDTEFPWALVTVLFAN